MSCEAEPVLFIFSFRKPPTWPLNQSQFPPSLRTSAGTRQQTSPSAGAPSTAAPGTAARPSSSRGFDPLSLQPSHPPRLTSTTSNLSSTHPPSLVHYPLFRPRGRSSAPPSRRRRLPGSRPGAGSAPRTRSQARPCTPGKMPRHAVRTCTTCTGIPSRRGGHTASPLAAEPRTGRCGSRTPRSRRAARRSGMSSRSATHRPRRRRGIGAGGDRCFSDDRDTHP